MVLGGKAFRPYGEIDMHSLEENLAENCIDLNYWNKKLIKYVVFRFMWYMIIGDQ